MSTNVTFNEVAGRKNFGPDHALVTTPQPCVMIATWDENHTPDVMMAAWAGQYDYKQIVVSMSRHRTTENLERTGAFTVSFADVRTVAESDYFGLVSGAKVPDKVARAGFTASPSPNVDAPIINEFPLCLECEFVEYQGDETGVGVIGKVVNVTADEAVMKNGKVDMTLVDAIAFDPYTHGYYRVSERVGDAFKDGLKLKK